ncbi:MAG: tripartite tricarboxylate transporter permease [Azospirillaceae bacterium]
MDILDSLQLGLATALLPGNLLYCFIGVFLGMVVGVLPGIGALAAISMLFPITFHIEPTPAIIMLAGIYYGTAYGSSIAAILLNVPGTASSAITCQDGYPMAKQGRAGVALFMSAVSSFIAGTIGIVLMILFSPLIVQAAREFNSPEYFSLMVLGLIAASTISSGSVLRAIAMVVLGILVGTIGMDMYTGIPRFTFGSLELMDGISLIALAVGLFGLTEVIDSVRKVQPGQYFRVAWRDMLPTRDDVRRSVGPTLRGSAVGSFFGALPGTGATIASFMSYALERRIAREPERFGKGAIEGVVAPEASNNAADQTAFIPTMTRGIPGSATMALILGVLIIHGISPGPRLIATNGDLFWGLVVSFWIGNVMLLILNLPLIGLWVRLLRIPYHLFYPAILMFVVMGVYAVQRSTFEVWVVLCFGLLGYAMRKLDYPAAPMLLGFVLGPLMEEHFRRALLLSQGDLATFVERPVSGVILLLALTVLVWTSIGAVRRRLRRTSSGLSASLGD